MLGESRKAGSDVMTYDAMLVEQHTVGVWEGGRGGERYGGGSPGSARDSHMEKYIIIIFPVPIAHKCGVNFARRKCEEMSAMSLLWSSRETKAL